MDITLKPCGYRCGHALTIAMGTVVVVAVLVLLSASQATDSLVASSRRSYQQAALAACTAVLDRYESKVVSIGNADPSGLDFADNFGMDYVGNVAVKWKIEPARTLATADDKTTSIAFIQNPRPANTAGDVEPIAADSPEQTNENKWLFRIAAEAVIANGDSEEGRTPDATVQGVRYVSVNKAPLFKHVIFYAQHNGVQLTRKPM